MEQLLRNVFLFLSKNKLFTKLAKSYGLKFGAKNVVAGEKIDDAVKIIQKLNEEGKVVTIDHLGEFIDSKEEARASALECIEAIRAIADNGLDAQMSLKLTSMGLDISEEIVLENMYKILDVGASNNVFVTIDMEDYERCQQTIDIFKHLKNDYENIGTVLQSYLYRTMGDIKDLNYLSPNLRLVKGAYKESAEVAFPDKKDVDENYKKIIKTHLQNGNYTAIATHDDNMVDYTKQLEKQLSLDRGQFEFQMLYGFRKELQKQLVEEGYTVRVYVPYGDDWYGYFMRRLAERPANIAFVLKGLFKK
ncbi:proline dehydrogenase family protein [Aquibacillus kalidii]|uniref:proline dehydrogenase family protein n=1 Tax=Aquibacillus kalidii TaxID=2762597 RepID=UPI0016464D32|nr:proline dehydrogenase [Aquibacillus kalidii]